MAQNDEKLITPVSFIVDLVLLVAFFAYMFTLLRPHVPSNDPKMVALWAGLATSCLTGVFWLCIQMFRVVFRYQRKLQK